MHVRHDDRSHDVSNTSHSIERLGTSTRILIDSPSRPECVACAEKIEFGTQHKCLTVRDQTGAVSEHLFCSEACLHEESRDD